MSVAATTSIYKRDVPVYLQAGVFYRSLNDDQDDGLFSVPADTLKPTLEITCTSDLVHLLNSLRFWSVSVPQTEIFDFVIKNGFDEQIAAFEADFPYLTFLRAVKRNMSEEVIPILDFALKEGRFEVVPFLHEVYGEPFGPSSVVQAAKGGNLNCLKYAHQHGCVITGEAFKACIYHSNIPCLEYAHLHSEGLLRDTACDMAASTNQLESLEFLHAHGYPCTKDTYITAAEMGFYEIVQFLHQKGVPWDKTTSRAACRGGNMGVITYLIAYGCELDFDTMKKAVDDLCFEWDATLCCAAVYAGYLHLLVFLHKQGCPWDARTRDTAIVQNRVDCLRYMHAKGAVWEEDVYEIVWRGGSEAMKEFMRNNTCEGLKPFALFEQEQQARESRT